VTSVMDRSEALDDCLPVLTSTAICVKDIDAG
jgi:hypothetical protein